MRGAIDMGIIGRGRTSEAGLLAATRGCGPCARRPDVAGAPAGVGYQGTPGGDAAAAVAIAAILGLLVLGGYGAYEIGARYVAGGGATGGLIGLGAYGSTLLLAEYSDAVAGLAGIGVLGLAGYGAYEIAGPIGVAGVATGVVATVVGLGGA